MKSSVAVVGAGLVGAGWAIVFARAGHPVRIYDEDEKIRAGVLAEIESNCPISIPSNLLKMPPPSQQASTCSTPWTLLSTV